MVGFFLVLFDNSEQLLVLLSSLFQLGLEFEQNLSNSLNILFRLIDFLDTCFELVYVDSPIVVLLLEYRCVSLKHLEVLRRCDIKVPSQLLLIPFIDVNNLMVDIDRYFDNTPWQELLSCLLECLVGPACKIIDRAAT